MIAVPVLGLALAKLKFSSSPFTSSCISTDMYYFLYLCTACGYSPENFNRSSRICLRRGRAEGRWQTQMGKRNVGRENRGVGGMSLETLRRG